MIVWIFFPGGAGGDGVANLLEQSSNVVPIDENKQWRIHRYVDSKVKFWAPTLQNTSQRINLVSQLNEKQLEIANSDCQYLVITSHDIQLTTTFIGSTIPDHKHIKILLKTSNGESEVVMYKLKNLVEFNKETDNQPGLINNVNLSKFDIRLDKIPDEWNEFKTLVDSIGLDIGQETFEHYRKIVSGELQYNTAGIEYYESYIDVDNITKYIKIN